MEINKFVIVNTRLLGKEHRTCFFFEKTSLSFLFSFFFFFFFFFVFFFLYVWSKRTKSNYTTQMAYLTMLQMSAGMINVLSSIIKITVPKKN